MKKTILMGVMIFCTIESQASLRCTWLETKAAALNEAVMAADQTSKETFCKLGNKFVKYAQEYIDECSSNSNLGMQGSAGMMLNNIQIIQNKCQVTAVTTSPSVQQPPVSSSSMSSDEYAELQRLRAEKAEREKLEMQRELERLRAEKQEKENSTQQNKNLTINASYASRRTKVYPYVCYSGKVIVSGRVIYNSCVRSQYACRSIGMYHFGKYPNDMKAHEAFKRCYVSNPKFVDTQGL
jgi:hypothetical protein